ncbi:MAG: hypothetical protein ACM3N0_07470 [Chloroflexota bacterium]
MSGRVVLVSAVGRASGAATTAAALACAGSEPDRPALLVDVDGARPRPALFASPGARRLEERLAAHRPDLAAAARGQTCHVTLGREACDEDLRAVLPLARDSLAAVHLPAEGLHGVLDGFGSQIAAVLLRADLPRDRALTSLVAAELIGRGLAVRVLVRPPAWIPARCALFGVLPADAPGGLPARLRERVLGPCKDSLDISSNRPLDG